MQIELAKVTDLKFDPKNSRTHDSANIDAIKFSLQKFGFQKPIVVAEDMTVIAGNGTLEAAIALGHDKIPIVKSTLKDSDRLAYALADNRTAELADWDMTQLAETLEDLKIANFAVEGLSFTDLWLDEELKRKGKIDDDEVPETKENEFNVQRGQIYQLGNHRLMCGDSTLKEDVDRLMNGEKADMVFTDPPYGVSYADKNAFLNTLAKGNAVQKRIENDHGSVDEMFDLWKKIFVLMCDYTTDKSSYYICSPQGGELMMMMMAIDQSPFSLKHTLIWVKNNHVLGRCDYNYKHEPILYGWKKKGTHEFIGKGRCKTSVWDFPKPLKNDLHPTMKPVELVSEAILNSCKSDGLVFEPFAGSGSTLIACEKTNRKCYGMEIDPHYCSVIIKRWQDFTGSQAKLL